VSEQLGLELRRIREERGLTVEELAEKSGISATTIRAAERGTREARGDTVAKLAKPLGLTFDEVWGLQRRQGYVHEADAQSAWVWVAVYAASSLLAAWCFERLL
jgi:transcriptional regulator with XRE-family HTH domain